MFFCSSRRRHTRFKCDWSSDVCSSDLIEMGPVARSALAGPISILVSGVGWCLALADRCLSFCLTDEVSRRASVVGRTGKNRRSRPITPYTLYTHPGLAPLSHRLAPCRHAAHGPAVVNGS